MESFRRLLVLVLALQMAIPANAFADGIPESDASEKYHAQMDAFISHYKQIHPVTAVNAELIRQQLSKDRFMKTYESWNMDARKAAVGTTDALALTREARRLQRVDAPLIQEAQRMVDLIISDSLFDRVSGQTATFNGFMFELFAQYIAEPQARPALDLFFQVLGDRQFSQEDRVQLEKNRSVISQATRPFTWNVYVTMGVVMAAVFARKWPKTDRLLKFISSRFNVFRSARETIAARSTQEAARSAGRFVAPSATPVQAPWWTRAWNRMAPGSLLRRNAPTVSNFPALVPTAPTVMKSVGQVMKEEPIAMKSAFSDAHLPNAKQVADQTIHNIEALNVSDGNVLAGIFTSVRIKTIRLGRQLTSTELNEIHSTVLMWKQMGEAQNSLLLQKPVPPKPTALFPIPSTFTPALAPQTRIAMARSLARKTFWSLPEMTIIGATKIFGRQREPWKFLRDTARFFNIPYRIGTAYGIVAATVNHLPGAQYTLIPEDEITHGVNAMGILSVACKADVLNARTLSLANQINTDVPVEIANARFVGLVKEMKELANEYTLTLRLAGMYTNEIPDVYKLPTIGIEQDIRTGTLTYTRKHEGEEYRIQVNCPSRKGRKIESVNFKEADRLVRLAVDRLALVEILNDLTESSVAALKVRYVDRMMALNTSAYNSGIQLMMERLPREPYLSGLFDALDERLNTDTKISGNRQRIRASAYKAERLKHMQAAGR